MKKIKIGENSFIVRFDGQYFISNEFTYKLLNVYEITNNLNDISSILDIDEKNLEIYFDEIQNRLKDGEYYNFNGVLEYPLKLQWKITNECNLLCKHCYVENLNDNKSLSDEKLIEITNKIVESSVMEVTLSGGEALCVNVLPKIIDKLTNSGVYVNIFTNGILLEEFIYKIKNKVNPKMIKFEVSIDGEKEIHNSIRGKGTYEKTIRGIKTAFKNGYFVMTNSVLSTMNYRNIIRLILKLNKIGVKKTQVSNIIISGNASEEMKLSKQQNEEFIRSLKLLVKKKKNTTEVLFAKMPDDEYDSTILSIDENTVNEIAKSNWKCAAGIGRATINYLGYVYCCPFLKNSYIGSILDDSFCDIWNNNKRYEFIKYLSEDNRNKRVCIVARNKR
jgi:MoaA/NifB/PqqE/SkfB family radical SAM enzyme